MVKEVKMRLYNTDLPEPMAENAVDIIKCCRGIHQKYVDRRKRNTKMQQWDKYWIDAYNVVLKVLQRS